MKYFSSKPYLSETCTTVYLMSGNLKKKCFIGVYTFNYLSFLQISMYTNYTELYCQYTIVLQMNYMNLFPFKEMETEKRQGLKDFFL